MKNRQNHLAIIAPIVALAIAGCVRTRISSQVAPQFQRAYGTIMVMVDFQNLRDRQDAEQRFQTELASRGATAVRSVDLFFPGRTYAPDERAQILQIAGVEAVLVTAPAAGRGTNSYWMLPATETTEGYYADKPWAEYEAVVVDVVSDQTVWIASITSGGNIYSDWGDLARAMAKTTSERLWEDGIVRNRLVVR